MSIAPLTFRSWLRYVVPLTALAALAMIPVALLALAAGAPADAAAARAEVRMGWVLAGSVWTFQLWLVAAAAPAVAAVARGERLSQVAAFARGARNLGRAIVPCAVAVLAIALGGLALVVPGLVLLVLVAMTGASSELGAALPAPLADSIAVARGQLVRIAVVIAIVLAADLALALVAQLVVLPAWTKKPPVALLLPARTFLRVLAAALIALSPLAASAIAATYARRR